MGAENDTGRRKKRMEMVARDEEERRGRSGTVEWEKRRGKDLGLKQDDRTHETEGKYKSGIEGDSGASMAEISAGDVLEEPATDLEEDIHGAFCVTRASGWCIIDPSVCGLGKKRCLWLESRKRGTNTRTRMRRNHRSQTDIRNTFASYPAYTVLAPAHLTTLIISNVVCIVR
ncbi:hypothetical protein WN55_10892 [Dufourea novaeangliae]|uniref:Uncharacterized protein n=1 Tax=Dufourea novaeangliae TaxID=178035 RepID=A0A154P9D2_DUFNO|nr:hypothetical protein WN55_10892 [Dufourea novaeangliae]